MLALLLFALSQNVLALRGRPGPGWSALGNNRDVPLLRPVRGNANLREYFVIFLLLMLTKELNGLEPLAFKSHGIVFVLPALCIATAANFCVTK